MKPGNEFTEKIILAGFGGQGILFLGKVIAVAGMSQNLEVSWIPSYGPEMRGGTANCHVIVSTKPIGSPIVPNPDVVIAMNLPSMEKFEQKLKKGGLLIYNTTLIETKPKRDDIEAIGAPLTGMADSLGNTSIANMVALGVYVGARGVLSEDVATKGMEASVSKKRKDLALLNVRAIKKGIEYVIKIRHGGFLGHKKPESHLSPT